MNTEMIVWIASAVFAVAVSVFCMIITGRKEEVEFDPHTSYFEPKPKIEVVGQRPTRRFKDGDPSSKICSHCRKGSPFIASFCTQCGALFTDRDGRPHGDTPNIPPRPPLRVIKGGKTYANGKVIKG
jgi:hypothetical protein